MFIPWSQLRNHNILSVDGSTAVVELRDSLLTMDEPARHQATIIILCSDGQPVPTTVPQIKELAKAQGRRILVKNLEELVSDMEPRPWHISDAPPTYAQAEQLAAEHRLPVIVIDQGRPVGLVQPEQALESNIDLDGTAFEFFDLSIPRPRQPFVYLEADATLAKMARDLRSLPGARQVFVLMTTHSGHYGMATRSSLNRAIANLAAEENLSTKEIWSQPLGRLEVAFDRVVQAADLDSVSDMQAEAMSQSGPTLLLREGVPAILYPGTRRSLAAVSPDPQEEDYSLDAVPDSVLADIPDRVSPRPSMLQIDRDARHVNLWLTNENQETLDRSSALVVGQCYYLALTIGDILEQSIIDWGYPPNGPQGIVEPLEEDAHLFVSVFSPDFRVSEPTRRILLPRSGNTGAVRFEIEPRHASPYHKPAHLEVYLYYRTYLVQTFDVQLEVVAAGATPRSRTPQVANLVSARTADFPAMTHLPARELSLTITRDGPDHYRFTFLVDPDLEDQATRNRDIKFSCRVRLTRDDLTHLITKARRQLYNIVQSFDLLQAHNLDAYRKATRALAQVGRQLYLKLFESHSAQALKEWMEESLPDGSTIQIVDLAGDFVFPWSLVYTAPPWADDQPIDVTNFWGWRYKIAILSSELLDTYRQADPLIDTDSPLRICIGLHERLAGTDRQKAFLSALESKSDHRVISEILTNRQAMSQALADADRDVYYFFCHGYTERIATDIQMDLDTVSQFATLTTETRETSSAHIRERLDDLFDVSDSWIRLTRGRIPLTMLKETVPAQFSRFPFVFLNMCESAQVLPSLSDGFVPFFIQRGARAVVGTECSMNTLFADAFARAFLIRFFQGEAVGHILWDLRRYFLSQQNPLALAYTLYCDADLRLAHPVLPISEPQQPAPPTQPPPQHPAPAPPQSLCGEDCRQAVEALWKDDEDGLMLTLAARLRAESRGVSPAQLNQWNPPEQVFAFDLEAGPEWVERMKTFGRTWWAKLEPKLYELLCDDGHPEHEDLMDALREGAKMLALALAPALVAQWEALPAVAVVIATIAAKKIADSSIEAVCSLWKESMEAKEEADAEEQAD